MEKHGLAQVHDIFTMKVHVTQPTFAPHCSWRWVVPSRTFLANIPRPSLPTHNETLSIPPHYSHEIMYQQQNTGQEPGKKTIFLSCS